jgi:hypothetical protein
MTASIQASVGKLGSNRPDDVILVQRLLLKRGFALGDADGQCGKRTLQAIVTFQTGFLSHPDGRIDPNGKSWQHLVASGTPVVPPIQPPASADGSLTRGLPRPDAGTMNVGLTAAGNAYMLAKLGNPRESYSQDCQPMTNLKLKKNVVSQSVGPFKVTGLKPAVESLQLVMGDIARERRDVYALLGTAGMLCCRNVRGSTSSISNHSWGTAIDLTVNKLLDQRGDGKVQYALAVIAPIFNRHGWYWGAAFRTEDAMHFEASKSLIDAWAPKLQG